MEKELDTLLRKEAIEIVPPHDRVRVLQSLLHSSEEGWEVASYSRSEIIEPLSHKTQVQDAYYQASCVLNQV